MGAGADWIKGKFGAQFSLFGEDVADLLDDLYGGIYHVNHSALKRVDWAHGECIRLTIDDSRMSTFDCADLTKLVVLAHDRCIRVEIQAAAHGFLWLVFSPRNRNGTMYERHPTLEDHIALLRD